MMKNTVPSILMMLHDTLVDDCHNTSKIVAFFHGTVIEKFI
jgi:hypothetical protein